MGVITISGTTDTIDTFLDAGSPTVNYGGDTTFGTGNIPDTYRAFIKFSLSAIPAGAVINSATLSVFEELNTFAINTRTMRAYRVKRAWTEGGVTWNTYNGSDNWGSAGCADTTNDREATDIGSVSIPSGTVVGTEIQVALTAASVQEMLDGGSFTNNGLLLKMDTESQDFNRFYSSEYTTDTAKIPKLVVNYTANSPSLSPSASLSPSVSASTSASVSASLSPSSSFSPSASESASTSPSSSDSASLSPSLSESKSASASSSASPSLSASSSASPSISPSASPSLAVYVDKYAATNNTYSDTYTNTGSTYVNKYNEFT